VQRVGPGGSVLYRKPFLAEPVAHELSRVRIIFNDEQSVRHANLTRL